MFLGAKDIKTDTKVFKDVDFNFCDGACWMEQANRSLGLTGSQ